MRQPPSARRARSRHGALVLVPMLGIGVLTGCGGSTAAAHEGEPVKVGLGAASGTTTVQAGDKLRVTARGGVLTEVTVTDPGGKQLAGGFAGGDTVWTSRTRTAPATKYSVVARTKNTRGAAGEVKESVTTARTGSLGAPDRSPGRSAPNGPPNGPYGGKQAPSTDRRMDGRTAPQQPTPFKA
ncbi:Ig-like domain-containing protein [Streptomyces sp. NPDC048483]|uniref:Ig-like domain-containing protein n=1 Tax=Streptomyces sp. NPDC048483 TaxID=3154927 RepID=UPI003433EDD3